MRFDLDTFLEWAFMPLTWWQRKRLGPMLERHRAKMAEFRLKDPAGPPPCPAAPPKLSIPRAAGFATCSAMGLAVAFLLSLAVAWADGYRRNLPEPSTARAAETRTVSELDRWLVAYHGARR